MPGPASVEEMGAKVDYQVAAPAETGTPNLHRAKIAQQQSADGRMATEAARRELKGLTGRRKKKNRLDSHRPSHGRQLGTEGVKFGVGELALDRLMWHACGYGLVLEGEFKIEYSLGL